MRTALLQPVIPGLLLSFLAIFMSIGVDLAIGTHEPDFITFLRDGIEAGPLKQQLANTTVANQTKDVWKLVQQTHSHAQGLGILGMGIILALAMTRVAWYLKSLLSFMIGLGAFLYPWYGFMTALQISTIGYDTSFVIIDWVGAVSAPLIFGGIAWATIVLFVSWLDPSLFPSQHVKKND